MKTVWWSTFCETLNMSKERDDLLVKSEWCPMSSSENGRRLRSYCRSPMKIFQLNIVLNISQQEIRSSCVDCYSSFVPLSGLTNSLPVDFCLNAPVGHLLHLLHFICAHPLPYVDLFPITQSSKTQEAVAYTHLTMPTTSLV